jgi:FHS family L-fucose permease-like MFS transporter
MTIVGGGLIPPLTGQLADVIGLRGAFIVPALCYLAILAFGLYAARPLSNGLSTTG